nr:MAG TPA: hypothetical protein [Caudoviricetes sp.]DAX75146.1 MAG TPA: hypothetical protein [Caudoviricetes sp.]
MIQLTKEQVMDALIENMSSEPDETGAIEYFLHITDNGEILTSFDKADETFSTYLDPEAYEEKLQEDPEYDFRDDVEVEDNKYFLEVVEELTKQANDYLRDWGEDD